MVMPAAEAAAGPQNVRASYTAPVRGADGRVDATATVNRLKELKANTYAYSVQNATDWADLPEFASSAQTAGLKVWVSLLPPSECPGQDCADYGPFFEDYLQWVRAIATLSRQYPAVTAWSLDDFDHNSTFFAPGQLALIRSESRAIQPNLQFYPTVYYDAVTPSFVQQYAPYMDALIMPFRDDPNRNTVWTQSLPLQLDRAAQLLGGYGLKVLLMVYAWHLSGTQVFPDVDYVRRATTIGMQYTRSGTIAGVIQYAMPLVPGRGQGGDRNFSHSTGTGALVLTVAGNQPTSAGDYAGVITTVRMDPYSASCRIAFWHADNRGAPSLTGYHMKQVLANGTKVWERDVAGEETDWYREGTIDLSAHFVDGVTRLSLRLSERAGVSNYEVKVRFDDITLYGCSIVNPSFETTTGWTYQRHGPTVSGQHIYDPIYRTSVFDAVASLYAT